MLAERQRELSSWLAERGLDGYFPLLDQHEVDLDALFQLQYAHLQEMGFAVGARLKLLKAIAERAPAGVDASRTSGTEQHAAERRQLTVLFCDVVGYTHLASQVDPEDTRRLMNGHWRQIEQTVTSHGGHIAQYLGDGALIYFGYPSARETDAEHAITAALAMLEALDNSGRSEPSQIHIRIGIATGLVVVGDDLGGGSTARSTLAVGTTVNLAARLQSLARPGSVIIDQSTRDIVGERFDLDPLAPIAVAGVDGTVSVFSVVGARTMRSRFEARRSGASTELVGRAGEAEIGLDLWRSVLRGQGQMLLVDGEPGIGKSRFVWELTRLFNDQGASVLSLQSSAQHVNTPFHPLIEGLIWLAGISDADGNAEKAAKVRSLFGSDYTVDDAVVVLLANLVGAAQPQTSTAPELQRRQTFEALATLFAARAKRKPLVLVIEDTQWCDPTTLEVLDKLRRELKYFPIMIVATSREPHAQVLTDAPFPVRISLKRLSAENTWTLVLKLFGGAAVPQRTLEFINGRADGVPLFIEELVRTMRDAGGPMLAEERDFETIPNSLQGILMERLDALQSARHVAQVASCIGRDFDRRLLAAILSMPGAELDTALVKLLGAGMIVETPVVGGGYSFKHALASDAAYSSLLFSERRTIHGTIATALGQDRGSVRPEILAHHLTQSQVIGPAIEKWLEAAVAAKLRSANVEAIAHIGKAMKLLDLLDTRDARNRYEFLLLIELIAPFRATKGFAAKEVADVTERAIVLADEARDVRGVLPLLYNQWVYKFVTASRETCQQYADEIMARCDYDEDDLVRMTGERALAVTAFTSGRLSEAVQHFETSMALYAPERQADATQLIGLDAMVVAAGYNSLACWSLGHGAAARASIERALSHASQVAHAGTTIFALYHDTLLRGVLERDPVVLCDNGASLEQLGTQNGFDMWAVCGRLLFSMGQCLSGPAQATIERTIGLLAEYQNMGLIYRPTYETFIAESWLALGDSARGLEHITEAHRLIATSGERWSESEVYRVEGELLLLQDAGSSAGSQLIEKAVAIADARDATAFADRAKASLQRRPALVGGR